MQFSTVKSEVDYNNVTSTARTNGRSEPTATAESVHNILFLG